MGKFIAAWRIFRAIYKFIKEVDANASERLCDENAQRDRLKAEAWLWRLSQASMQNGRV